MNKYFENWASFLKETQLSVNISDYTPKDRLNEQVWLSPEQLRPEISVKLLEIAKNFLEGVGLDSIVIADITFTGSLANYNWSDYSDIDLHILVDFDQIDENTELVQEFFRGKIGVWNRMHDINFRKCGLDKSGEYSIENLAFRMLRRGGQLEKLSDLALQSYDQMMSLNENYNKNWTKYSNS